MDEAFFGLVVASQIEWQEFEGNRALELGVFGFVNDTHTSAAEFLDDFVMGNSLADHFFTL
jgi:hypothetical protein